MENAGRIVITDDRYGRVALDVEVKAVNWEDNFQYAKVPEGETVDDLGPPIGSTHTVEIHPLMDDDAVMDCLIGFSQRAERFDIVHLVDGEIINGWFEARLAFVDFETPRLGFIPRGRKSGAEIAAEDRARS